MHRVWIKDMAVTMAVLDEELFRTGGRGQRSIRKENCAECASCMRRVGNVYRPTLRSGRSADRIDGTASRRDQRGGHMLLTQQRDHAINCVAFADATGIELHRRMIDERDSAGRRIEMDVAPARLLFQSEQLLFRRDASVIEEEPPCAHQGPDGDVKGSIGTTAPGECSLHKVEGFGIGSDRMCTGITADT